MVRSGFVLLLTIALALACRKQEPDLGRRPAAAKPELPGTRARPDVAPHPDATRATTTTTTTATTTTTTTMSEGAPVLPLATGKTVRIKGLDVAPLEATAPPDFKFRMEGPGEDFGDRAHLEGPDFVDIIISPPDDGKFVSLSEQRQFLKELSEPPSIVHAQELSPGFVVIYERIGPELKPEFTALVSLPNLGVTCDAMFLHSRADAELCASVCLSLRRSKRRAVDLSALPPLRPLTEGKLVRIDGLKTVPLAITVPAKFRYRLGPSVGPEGPDANFDGPGHTMIVVEPPRDGKFLTLAEEREKMLKEHPSAMVVRADETAEGFLLIGFGSWSGGEYEYDVTVSRPGLKVVCGATPQKRLASAERLASACLSLHAASDQER